MESTIVPPVSDIPKTQVKHFSDHTLKGLLLGIGLSSTVKLILESMKYT